MESGSGPPMLEALQLAARRGHTSLFSGLSFSIKPGEALVVTGANGTGKTTLLRMVAGLCTPAAGEIRWNGSAVRPLDPQLRSALAFAGHHPALKDELTAEENLIALAALSDAKADRTAVRAALDAVALTRQRALPARVLSQGQRRRIALARLALVKRALWLLDEPLTALDAAGTAVLGTMLADHLRAGGMAVAATHTPLELPHARMRSLALA